MAGSNNFTGTLRNTIPVNSSLQLLHVDYNKLTGALPTSLANAQHLVDLDTTQNALTGTIPSAVGAIPTLENFVVKMNNLTGKLPSLSQSQLPQGRLACMCHHLLPFCLNSWSEAKDTCCCMTCNIQRLSC